MARGDAPRRLRGGVGDQRSLVARATRARAVAVAALAAKRLGWKCVEGKARAGPLLSRTWRHDSVHQVCGVAEADRGGGDRLGATIVDAFAARCSWNRSHIAAARWRA